MAFWDRLFSLRPPAQTPPAGQAPRRLAWAQVPSFLEERQRALLEPELREASSALSRIQASLVELNGLMPELFLEVPDTGNPAVERIARHMRENYLPRARKTVSELLLPPPATYPACRGYHAALLSALSELNKNASDNRYLAGIFRKDYERLALHVKDLAEAAEVLGRWLNRIEPLVLPYAEAETLWKQGEAARARQTPSATGDFSTLEQRIKDVQAAADSAAAHLKILEETESRTQAELASSKARAMELLSPLARPLRKLQKLTENPALSSAAARYAGDPWNAAGADAGLQKLNELLKALEQGQTAGLVFDEKERQRVHDAAAKILNGALEQELARVSSLDQKASQTGAQLSAARLEYGKSERLLEAAHEELRSAKSAQASADDAVATWKDVQERVKASVEKASGIKIVIDT